VRQVTTEDDGRAIAAQSCAQRASDAGSARFGHGNKSNNFRGVSQRARTEVDLDLNAAVVRWEVRILLLHPRSHRGALRMRGVSQIVQRVI
jgi:hypothetical protein